MPAEGLAQYRHGGAGHRLFVTIILRPMPLICECEMVTAGEIDTCASLDVDNLVDLRRRTRLGMGPCQGSCAPIAPPV